MSEIDPNTKERLNQEGFEFADEDYRHSGGAAVFVGSKKEIDNAKKEAILSLEEIDAADKLFSYFMKNKQVIASGKSMHAIWERYEAERKRNQKENYKLISEGRKAEVEWMPEDKFATACAAWPYPHSNGPGSNFGLLKEREAGEIYDIFYGR